MMVIPSDCAAKLSKMIPRLASDHDGEIVATVKGIMRVLASSGVSLHDLAETVAAKPGKTQTIIVYKDREPAPREKPKPAPKKPVHVAPECPADTAGWEYVQKMAPLLLDGDVSEKEQEFIQHMYRGAGRWRETFRMTVKQQKWWNDILDHNGF